jgi:hypothetical protein
MTAKLPSVLLPAVSPGDGNEYIIVSCSIRLQDDSPQPVLKNNTLNCGM